MFDILSVMKAIKSFNYVCELVKALYPNIKKFIAVKKNDEFLNYDPAFLLDTYTSEHPIANGIPYSEIFNWLSIPCEKIEEIDNQVKISKTKTNFQISEGRGVWSTLQSGGFVALQNSGRIIGNEPSIRLFDIQTEGRKISMKVQRADYHSQAKSNLILDWHLPESVQYNNRTTLRTLLSGEYGTCLPELSDKRLANTVGIASLLFYKENGQWIPYLVKRTKKIGVFPGGLHCTASGIAKWPDINKGLTFSNFFLKHMLSEFEEEVGLTEEDIFDHRPIALCREFSRGGKPQIFFAGVTRLSRDSLRKKRKQATDVIKELNGWEEIERDKWLRSAHVVVPPTKLMSNVKKYGLTLEAVGSFHYGMKYLEKYGAEL